MGESEEHEEEEEGKVVVAEFKAIYDSLEEIPESVEDFRALFTERDDKFELRLPGIRTQRDIDKQQIALDKERILHKATKAKLEPWKDMDLEEIQASLDRIPELEVAAGDKLDDEAIEKIVAKRVENTLRSSVAPLERDLKKAHAEIVELSKVNVGFLAKSLLREREDAVRPLLFKAHILPEYHEDVLLYSERHLEKAEEGGGFFARSGINGVTSGNSPVDWLAEMVEKRPGWIPAPKGGGAKGSGGVGGFSGSNPFSRENWNMTKQGQIAKEKGMEYAERLAIAAGTKLGGGMPPPKKVS